MQFIALSNFYFRANKSLNCIGLPVGRQAGRLAKFSPV
jgi:hypothetical protein